MVFVAYSDLTALNNLQPAIPQRFLRSFAVWAPGFLFGLGFWGGVFFPKHFFHSALKQVFLVPLTGPVWPSGYVS